MELPNDVWSTIIDHIGLSSHRDIYALACFLFLPLVNKQLHQICKVHPSVQAHFEEQLDYTLIMEYFAFDNNLSCLKFAHENGFDSKHAIDCRILLAAAKKDNYEILEYLILQDYPRADNALKSAIIDSENKSTKCLEVLHKARIPFEDWDIERTIELGYMDKFEYLWAQGTRPRWKSIPAHIISNPKPRSMVDYLIKTKNFTVDLKSFEYYYEKGEMRIYEYAYTNGHPWPDNITAIATRNNQLQGLRYVHEHGAQWHFDTCLVASENGAYNCLSYAHEHGAEWNQQACLERAMEYLHKAIDALDEPDYGFSMGYIPPYYDDVGLLKCIKYLLAHQNCKYDANNHVTPSEAEQTKMLKDYLDQRGALTNINFAIMYTKNSSAM